MKVKLLTISAVMVVTSNAAFGAWTIEQLKSAQAVALETFRQQNGETAFQNIFGISIEKNTQETAGNAKITYKDAGVKKEVKYFCHEHDADIDCH